MYRISTIKNNILPTKTFWAHLVLFCLCLLSVLIAVSDVYLLLSAKGFIAFIPTVSRSTMKPILKYAEESNNMVSSEVVRAGIPSGTNTM